MWLGTAADSMTSDFSPPVLLGDSHSDSDRSVCAGYDNGDVKLFDLRTMSLRWETNLKNGVGAFVSFRFTSRVGF